MMNYKLIIWQILFKMARRLRIFTEFGFGETCWLQTWLWWVFMILIECWFGHWIMLMLARICALVIVICCVFVLFEFFVWLYVYWYVSRDDATTHHSLSGERCNAWKERKLSIFGSLSEFGNSKFALDLSLVAQVTRASYRKTASYNIH
jgi:hypothetical protein